MEERDFKPARQSASIAHWDIQKRGPCSQSRYYDLAMHSLRALRQLKSGKPRRCIYRTWGTGAMLSISDSHLLRLKAVICTHMTGYSTLQTLPFHSHFHSRRKNAGRGLKTKICSQCKGQKQSQMFCLPQTQLHPCPSHSRVISHPLGFHHCCVSFSHMPWVSKERGRPQVLEYFTRTSKPLESKPKKVCSVGST